eukprot:CAMPEP_0184372786 /NCGR_PEP_ID=MMETSP1089-20130417/164132_1 /TAXON_ID=38269 ORGANISM="Gloeochaete wittrockiana, Strain SAG46.84" /NCGR_SAMPLE_ID=MMETSP1089 /ASSEMBLY_ACC=CAM_ASM_000445 /LENGTH=613 /DNA_ID=CAMNT_0026715657 /DNA_START=464 /DNA_END=2302 /DNA_ORIENTATION=-
MMETPSFEGDTPLIKACSMANDDIVRILVKSGGNVHSKDKKGITPLLAAASSGSMCVVSGSMCVVSRIVQKMKEEGCMSLLEDVDEEGYTPLLLAASKGHRGVVKYLLTKGANAQHTSHDGTTSVFAAVLSNDAEAAQLCDYILKSLDTAEERKELVCQVRRRKYPLEIAIINRKENTVGVLLQHGAEADVPCFSQGTTLIDLACSRGMKDVVEKLLLYGADCMLFGMSCLRSAVMSGSDETVKLVLEKLIDGTFKKKDEDALFESVQSGNREGISKALEELRYGFRDCDEEADKLLLLAKSGKLESVRAYIENKKRELFLAGLNETDAEGYTPLMHAALKGRRKIVEMLLNAGANPQIYTKFKETPLSFAVQSGDITICQMILDAIPSLDERRRLVFESCVGEKIGGEHMNVLTVAITKCRVDLVELLLKNGSWVTRTDIESKTALMLAASRDMEKAVRTLLLAGADIRAVNQRQASAGGKTALMFAAQGGFYRIVKLLMLYECGLPITTDVPDQKLIKRYKDYCGMGDCIPGIHLRAPDPDHEGEGEGQGETAVDIAMKNGHMDVVGLLVACGARARITRADITDSKGLTGLMVASKMGLRDFAQSLRRHK